MKKPPGHASPGGFESLGKRTIDSGSGNWVFAIFSGNDRWSRTEGIIVNARGIIPALFHQFGRIDLFAGVTGFPS